MPSKSGKTAKSSSKSSKKDVKIWSVDGKVDKTKRVAKVAAAISEKNILPAGRTRARVDYNYSDRLSKKEEEGKTLMKKLPERSAARESHNTTEKRAKNHGVRKVRKTKGGRDAEEKTSRKRSTKKKASTKKADAEEKSE